MPATPGSAELILEISHSLAGHSFALITGGHHEEVASKIVATVTSRLAAKPAEDVRELQKRVKRYGSFCDPECEGRCRECPDELIRDLAAALSPTQAPKP